MKYIDFDFNFCAVVLAVFFVIIGICTFSFVYQKNKAEKWSEVCSEAIKKSDEQNVARIVELCKNEN